MYKELTLYLYTYLMADTAKGSGRILPGEQFEFTLDGLATAKQMDNLISSISKSMGGTSAGGASGASGAAASLKRGRDRLDKFNESVTEATKTNNTAAIIKAREAKKAEQLEKALDKVKGAIHNVGTGGSLTGALHSLDTNGTRFALGLGTLVGALSGYADKLTEGLQRGISGGIFDYAIAAKTAGVNIETFSKAIGETAGGFAGLGVGATDGAKQFGALVSSVREATAGVGNLGMTNEQMAMFTAQQTKTAISQGFKGKAAQEVVIKNSRALGDELDTLANRTGKSVIELAAAAMKLAQDPIVANFVQTSKRGGDQISKAVQQFGASLRGVFGEAGDAIAGDTLKSALGGLPLVITQTGKNMIMASSAVYSELERQANIVKRGGDITAEDQEKLRNTVIKEVEARGAELRMLANLEGPMGESAKQLLALAEQANFYNSEAGAQRREEDKTAQQFNKSIRELQANIQKLSIPFLALANTIDWSAFINVLSAFADIISIPLKALTGLGELLGTKNLAGTVLGTLFGLAAVAGLLTYAQTAYRGAVVMATKALLDMAAKANFVNTRTARAYDIGHTAGGAVGGKYGNAITGAGMGILGSGAATAMMGGSQSTAGTAGNMIGGVAGGAAGGALGGMIAGRFAGSIIGSLAGPVGALVVGSLGAMLGQWIGDKLGGASGDLASVGSDSIGSQQAVAQAQLGATNKLVAAVEKNTGEVVAGNYITQRGVSATNDVARMTREKNLFG